MRSSKGLFTAASLGVSVVVLVLLACGLKLHSVLQRRAGEHEASLLAREISQLLFLCAATKGEVSAELELPPLSALSLGGNPVRVSVRVGDAEATEYIDLPLPLPASSWTSPSRLRILKSDFLMLVEAT